MDSGSRSSFLVGERVEGLLQWGPAYLGERKNERTPMMGAFRKERPWRELRATLICADVRLAASSSDQGFVSRRLSLRSSPPSLLPLSLLQHFWNAYEVPGAKALETGLSLRDGHLCAARRCRFPTWRGKCRGERERLCPEVLSRRGRQLRKRQQVPSLQVWLRPEWGV